MDVLHHPSLPSATPSTMPPTKTHSGNGHQIEAISRTSSVLTPVVKDGVEEIASRLIEM